MTRRNETTGLRTWVEIDRSATKHNYTTFRSLLSDKTMLMAVVKSNAYGHDLVTFAQGLDRLGAEWFGVDTLVEGVALRKAGITKPILVLGYTLPENIATAIVNNMSITVADHESLALVIRHAKTAPKKPRIHLKIDTGMHRQGFMGDEQAPLLTTLRRHNDTIIIEGLYTHFAAAKNPTLTDSTDRQIELFTQWIEAFHTAGHTPLVHACATSGTLLYPHAHFDMVRVGIGLYGIWPSPQVRAFAEKHHTLKPVLSWRSLVARVKEIPKGSAVGYDGTEIVQKKTRIAVIPIGYWHGYPRSLSGIGSVLIGGKRAKLLGRVSMDMIVVDVTNHKNVSVGDEVVLIGTQNKETITADEVATLDETTPYETLTQINPLIRRIINKK